MAPSIKRLCQGVLIGGLLVSILAFVLRQNADPVLFPAAQPFSTVDVIDHGYHASIVFHRAQLADTAEKHGLSQLQAVLALFDEFERVEIGWGEKEFYRNVSTVNLAAIPFVLRAIFNPNNQSVVHIVGFNGGAKDIFLQSSQISLTLSEDGFRRSAVAIEKTLTSASPLGPGLYGPSAFFESGGRYSLLNTCNHWVGQILARAGVPYAPVESFISFGLMFDLKRRVGNLKP